MNRKYRLGKTGCFLKKADHYMVYNIEDFYYDKLMDFITVINKSIGKETK